MSGCLWSRSSRTLDNVSRARRSQRTSTPSSSTRSV
jgi:hypothetical protein